MCVCVRVCVCVCVGVGVCVCVQCMQCRYIHVLNVQINLQCVRTSNLICE